MLHNIKHYLVLIILCQLFVKGAIAQAPYGNITNWISGYNKEYKGETLGYFSAFPDYINQSLLTRCTDGKKIIEWETAVVPKDLSDEYVYFRWVAAHSTGTSKGIRHFDLYINNNKTLTFSTKPGNNTPFWQFTVPDSTSISFVQLKTDAANDAHGIIYLRVPTKLIEKDKPVLLKVIGQELQSNDWFMTFKYSFEERADITPMPFILKSGDQVINLTALHFGNEEQLTVLINNKIEHHYVIKEGMNAFDIPVKRNLQKSKMHVKAYYSDNKIVFNDSVNLSPIQYREIHFIHHSHTDIGYSHLQPEVERIHTKNIYDALLQIEKTKTYPVEAKFKWNVESLWAVENFLKDANSNDKKRFFDAVRNGSIGLSAMYANMLTGLSMPEEMLHYTDYAKQLAAQNNITINSAMVSDVPGNAWNIVTALQKAGVKYFSSGPNYFGTAHPYHGDRVGHFVKTWGDKPVWWQSASGKEKILFWTAAKGYSSWHGFAPGAIAERGAKRIATYLTELDEKKYPYELVQWRYNCVADNAPIDSTISDFVKKWNEQYSSPKIVLATTEELFTKFEKKYGDILPTVKGDITPYWEDGAASTAYEEGINRANSLKLQQLTTLYSILAPQKYEAKMFYNAWKNIILFHEHTWGAHNSISTPEIDFVKEQWRIKKGFMEDADNICVELKRNIVTELMGNNKTIAVINTLNWNRNGLIELPKDFAGNALIDNTGKTIPVQVNNTGKKVAMINNLQPYEIRYYKSSIQQAKSKAGFAITDSTISNGMVTIKWNKTNGSINLYNKDGVLMNSHFNNGAFNNFWYIKGLDPKNAASVSNIKVMVIEKGPYVATIQINATSPGINNLTSKITLLHQDEKVYIENEIDKKEVYEKEAAYFSFPFANDFTQITLDAGYGTMNYITDQLPGSNRDFISNKRWIDASNDKQGVQLINIEAVMISPGNMVDERLQIDKAHKKWLDTPIVSSTWHSYIMNNYWHTNYKASQGGKSIFRYVLRAHNKLNNVTQEKTAMEVMQPLIVTAVKDNQQFSAVKFKLNNQNLVITSITPLTNQMFQLRVFNPTKQIQTAQLHFASGIDTYNATLQPNNILQLAPFEVKEVVIAKKYQ